MTTDELKDLKSCAITYPCDAGGISTEQVVEIIDRLLAAEAELARLKAKYETEVRMMVSIRGGDPHTECPDCRGVCVPYKPAVVVAGAGSARLLGVDIEPSVVRSCENCGGPEYPCDSPGCDGWNKPAVKRIEPLPKSADNEMPKVSLQARVDCLEKRVKALEAK